MSADTGGPAFPFQIDLPNGDGSETTHYYAGVTMRDWFAAHASDADIEALRLRTKREQVRTDRWGRREVGLFEPDNWRQIARYMHADLMLKARST